MRKLIRFLEQVLVCIKNQYKQHKEIKKMQMQKEIQRGREIRRTRLSPTRIHLLQPLQTSGDQVEINNNDRKIKN